MSKSITIQSEAGAVLASVVASHGPDSIIVKRLGWKRLEEAERAQMKQAMSFVRDIGGSKIVQEIQSARGKDKDERPADPLASFDKSVLLISGIVSLDGQPKSAELIDDLEPETATEAAKAILQLSRPDLFVTDVDRKNG